jgi:hypothetical protein
MPPKVTIITPCSRVNNLQQIRQSIDFNKIHRWIIVYDGTIVPEGTKTFDHPQIEEFSFSGEKSWGHPQRNHGFDQIKEQDTFVYYLDDDNLMHPGFYELLPEIKEGHFYTFDQLLENQIDVRSGAEIKFMSIDTAQFLIYAELCSNIRWGNQYCADFNFINDCNTQHPEKHIYWNKVGCYYNKLR